MKNIDITANQMRVNQGYRVIDQIVIYVFNHDNVKNSSPVVEKTSLS